MQTFTDLVGTAVVPAHCFDSSELTDLTPALDNATATAGHDMAAQASETNISIGRSGPTCFFPELADLTPALDIATATHDMADQASEALSLTAWGTGAPGCL